MAWGLGTRQNNNALGSDEWTGKTAAWHPSARYTGDWHLTTFGSQAVVAAILEALEHPPPLPE